MTLGQVKAEALKLMFVSPGDDICPEDLADLGGQENFREYLVNMNGSMNRCFADLESRRVLPVKSFSLKLDDAQMGKHAVRFALADLIPDFFDVSRVVCEGEYEYNGDCEYRREGDVLVMHAFDTDLEYRLLYFPKLARVNESWAVDAELPVPDALAAFIPYFIKGDLYRDDEPNEAGEARNWYEQALAQVVVGHASKVGRVETRYSQAGDL